MSQTDDQTRPHDDSARLRPSLRPLVLTLATGAVLLGAFDFFSAGSETAQRALLSDRPPVYGRYEPGLSKAAVFAFALTLVAAVASLLVARRPTIRPAWFLAGAVGFLFVFATAVAVVDGTPNAFTDPLERVHPPDYQADVHLVRELGARSFVEAHPTLMPSFRSVHSRTHPPGPLLLLSALQSLFPNDLVPRALVLTLLSALVLVPAWLIAKTMYGDRAATYAVLLLAVAPAPVIFGVTSLDSVFATLLAATGLLAFWALGHRREPRLAAVAGAVAGAMTIMTYGVAFVAAGAGVYAFLRSPWRTAARLVAAAAVGGVAAIAFMRLAFGFDLLGSFRAGYDILADESQRSYFYWIFGNPGVWLTFAGLPIAALSVRELLQRRPRFLIALFVPLVLIDLNHKFAGETERIGQFAYPFVAAAAAGWLARSRIAEQRPWIVSALVVLTALQAITLEALFYTFW